MLGARKRSWLVDRSARRSTATWKVIAGDLPIGLVVPDGTDIEGVAQGRPGRAERPRARDRPGAARARRTAAGVTADIVWLTADVHYTAAHHYAPGTRAAVGDFTPFWEFVSGPLHAGAFGPNTLDPRSARGRVRGRAARRQHLAADGFQHFGEVEASREELTVWLRDATGASLWTKTLKAR